MSTQVVGVALAGPAPDGSRLYAIVYISTAAHLLSAHELEHLHERAQARNRQEQVTGLLLYSDGAFMQYLEGPAAGLARVYGFIKADPLHYGVIDLLREPIQRREFAAWSMALRAVGAQGRSPADEQDTLLVGEPGALAATNTAARELLLNFWRKGRCSVASTLRDFSTDRSKRLAAAMVA